MESMVIAVVSGFAFGSVYGIFALGAVIIYRATAMITFAQGPTALFFVYVGWQVLELGWPLAIAIAVGIVGCAIAGVLTRQLLSRMGSGRIFQALVVTMGLGLIIDSTTLALWGGSPKSFPAVNSGVVSIAGASIRAQLLLAIVLAIVAMIAVAYLFLRTPLGSAMRAAADDASVAGILGVPASHVARLAWALGMALSALAVFLLAPSTGLVPGGSHGLMFYAIAALFLGGLNSMIGAVIGGVVIGLMESLGSMYISASYQDLFLFSIVVFILLLRPNGIFGKSSAVRV